MKEKELKELKLTKNIIIPFPNFQPNTIISPTQINDNFEEIEYAYNNLIDLHNGAISKVEDSLNRSDEAIDRVQGVENDLQDSERKRILNENTRITNESARISSENIRIENENTRNSKENTRIANETQREQQELERMSTYQTHINDEIKREEKHNQMINSFNEKVTEVDEAIASIPTKEELKGEKGDKGDRGEQGVKGDTPSITHLETSINNKIQEVETRFATLTSSRQQDAEVIDARDGETSLKARLDRDLYKDGISLSDRIEAIEGLKDSQNMKYETDKGYLVCKETKNGVIDDLKIEGKTLVNLLNDFTSFTNRNYIYDTFSKVLKSPVGGNDSTIWSSILPMTSVECNKSYTLILNVLGTSSRIQVRTDDAYDDINIYGLPQGLNIFAFIPKGENFKIKLFDGSIKEQKSFSHLMLLEGDYTQNPPSYFEGLMSVGQDVDKIEVLSRKEDGNLVEPCMLLNYTIQEPNTKETYRYATEDIFIVKPNTNYTFSTKADTHTKYLIWLDSSKQVISRNGVGTNNKYYTCVSPTNAKYCQLYVYSSISVLDRSMEMIDNEWKLTEGSFSDKYTPHQSDKKQILFYNENGELEPIQELHEWDSIEKHSDNKWYYHKRSGKVVLNGSENWVYNTGQDTDNTFRYNLQTDIGCTTVRGNIMCDKLSVNLNIFQLTDDKEGICNYSNGQIFIRMLKSKLSSQDVTGFKQWLQTNNVTVVYQLAEEEVYELAPLHLDSYANETLILCNSGAISPKMEFSITSHINELIKSQGDRISLLEEKMYKALKQVLAGDMYSLAELLYPEDFVSKEEPIDVPTLLI